MNDTRMAHKVALFYLLINYFHRFEKYYHQNLWDNHFRSTPTVTNVKAKNSKDLSIEHGWQDLVRSIANGKWIFSTFICLCLFDSVLGLAVNNLLRVITPTKSMSKSTLGMLPSEVGIQVRLLVGISENRSLYSVWVRTSFPWRHQLCGYMPWKLEKLRNFNVVNKLLCQQLHNNELLKASRLALVP